MLRLADSDRSKGLNPVNYESSAFLKYNNQPEKYALVNELSLLISRSDQKELAKSLFEPLKKISRSSFKLGSVHSIF